MDWSACSTSTTHNCSKISQTFECTGICQMFGSVLICRWLIPCTAPTNNEGRGRHVRTESSMMQSHNKNRGRYEFKDVPIHANSSMCAGVSWMRMSNFSLSCYRLLISTRCSRGLWEVSLEGDGCWTHSRRYKSLVHQVITVNAPAHQSFSCCDNTGHFGLLC